MKNVFCLLGLLLCFGANAQSGGSHFITSVQAGLLEGERGNAFQLKATSGVQYKTWTGGIGAGLDYYHTRSFPLFLALEKQLSKGVKSPFLYANGGYNFPWLKEQEGSGLKARGGMYFDAGAGYQLPVKKSALFFSIGYSQKAFTTAYRPEVWIEPYPYYTPPVTKLAYNLRRLSIQTGLRF